MQQSTPPLRHQKRHCNISCHATPVMYLWWAAGQSPIVMNAKPASRHSVMTEGQLPRPTVGEDNSILPTFTFPIPSSPTVVMVSLTSVSPLLYASPNINRRTASLINAHQTSPAPPPTSQHPPHPRMTTSVCWMTEMKGSVCAMAMMTLMMT